MPIFEQPEKRYKLTLREVQERSEALAKKYGRREFAILEYANYAIFDEVIESEPPLQTKLLSRSDKSSDRLRRAVVG